MTSGTVLFAQVSNLLLQVFDEGRLSDSKGHAVDYRNTVILMTSNLGSDLLANVHSTLGAEADGASPEQRQELLRRKKTEIATKLVHSHFSPEFVNRLDDVIVFNPLSEPAMLRICNIQLEKVGFLVVWQQCAELLVVKW
jgi:ATP-dependent Clp protease ATP-binding subunit ClpA